MRFFLYAIVFAIVFLVFKAFFLDAYLQERGNIESNNSTETVQEGNTSLMYTNSLMREKNEKERMDKEEVMPLDQLGNSIADKIADKL